MPKKILKTPLSEFRETCREIDTRFAVLSKESLDWLKMRLASEISNAYQRGRKFGQQEPRPTTRKRIT